jgi:hypothetical protein
MSHHLLNHPRSHAGLVGQGGTLAPQSVEVKDESASVTVRDSRSLEILAKHRRSLTLDQGENLRSCGQGANVGPQVIRQVFGQGQGRRFAVFRARGGH